MRWRASSATSRSTASCSTSAFRRCSSTRPSAAFRSGSTVRSTCAWAATGRAPPIVVAHASERDLASDHLQRSARSASRVGRPRHRRGTRQGADRDHRRARRHRRHAWSTRGRTASIRRRGRSRRCASSSTRSWPSLRPALAAAERILKPGGRLVGGHLPFARGPHRQDVPRRAQRRARHFAPCARDRRRQRRPSRLSPSARSPRTTPRSPPIRARARPSCAPPSAPPRRRAHGDERSLLPRLPSLADVMKGR